ncbi:hypothetical protein O181_083913 [Austropuccinia psidii MF-1]|uniref:Uncharacterized protein n=1 Tax=Austropuccinia psidii MF-1 TaxID=1389203 RepID=A0A9Q3FUL1_9BASI|nr:hypothetical protein [Austropuccinia psidii MF-1]
MLTPGALPTAPDKQLLKEFYQLFSSVEEVQSVAQNSQGVKLINEAQVQTLCNAHSGKRKIGKNIINMQDFYITYFHAMLAKLYWESTVKKYKIDPGTPESSKRDSNASSLGDVSVDSDAQRDFNNNVVLEEEFIYNGEESDVELSVEEDSNENGRSNEVSQDVAMSDAWDTRLGRANWRLDGIEENLWE